MDMTLDLFLAICLGGGLGSMLRVALGGWVGVRLSASKAVFAINLSGSFLLGAAFAFTAASVQPDPASLAALTVFKFGVLGGYTTVSTYALQVLERWCSGDPVAATWIAVGSVIACPLAALAGVQVMLVIV